MCSVTNQHSKQRGDVGWLVVLVSDELSTEAARRRLNRGVATGRRQTVEAATGQTRRHGVGAVTSATGQWRRRVVSNGSEMTRVVVS